MQRKWIKIGVLVILVIWILINLNVSIDSRADSSTIKLANVEALASPESGEWYSPCVKANGFCFVNGIDIDGITMIKE